MIGRLIELDGEAHTVMGVPGRPGLPRPAIEGLGADADSPAAGNYLALFNAVALLAPGATPGQARRRGNSPHARRPERG